MTDSETVYMSRSGQTRVYHTDERCVYLPEDTDDYREVDRAAVNSHYDECKECASDAVPPGNKLGGQHAGKLDPDDVREIRERYAEESGKELAREFGVSASAIYECASGRSWTWVE